jgi:cytochrome oxidase Cu insertion factor (SCO1/SenC/PrrC family)
MNSPHTEPQVDSKRLFWNRFQLIMILLVFLAPIVGAFLYKPVKFNNYGDIYTPVRSVENLLVTGADGEFEFDSLRRTWVLLVVANRQCGDACEENLLKIRQLRFMQNNNMTRIRSVFLHTQIPPVIADDLTAKYQPNEAYSASFDAYDKWTQILKLADAPKQAQEDRIYIIDPAGNLVMSYPAGADPSLIKKDIKRLLKTSQIG